MKPRRLELPSSGYQSPLLSYWMVVALVICAILLDFRGMYETRDTLEYYAAGDLLFQGEIFESRTPVFPFILHIFKLLFGYEGSKYAVIVFQTVLSAVSAIYIYKSIRLIVPKNERLCFWVTVAYVVAPFMYFSWWLIGVLTDTLTIQFSTFLVYNVIKSAQSKASFWYSIWTSWWLLILIFLRPIMLCFIPVVVIFWVALYLQNRRLVLKSCAYGLGGLAVIVLLVGLYIREMDKKYHIHTMSAVSINNNYGSLRYAGLITPEDTDCPAFQKYLAEKMAVSPTGLGEYEAFVEMGEIRQFSLPVVEKAVSHCIRHKAGAVLKMILKRFVEVANHCGRMVAIELFYLFAACILLIYTFWQRKFLLIPSILFLFVASVLGATFIGTMAEWERISSPMFPMLILFVGWAFSKLRLVSPKEYL